ncbi:MAG: DegT/DnrJ/EryC1/StrS aminotransferase family protein [Magnetococcales bacterium]|nr:DegT/DnrJ/EryC1/StrS aminotransferase family protein [Magnetococcales bacterium]
MNRIFLGPLSPEDLPAVESASQDVPPGAWFVASGHHALRLLLRQQALRPGARVALPALICPTVVSAIRAEGLIPDFVDIEPEWQQMAFDADRFARRGFDLILLPHLYGAPHPLTREIRAFAGNQKIPLIHDAAQSFGVALDGTPLVSLDQGGLYSFGPGKATTAATGGLVYGLGEEMARRFGLDRFPSWDPWAQFFLRQRMGIKVREPWSWLAWRGWNASRIQVRAANLVMSRFAAIEQTRRLHWSRLQAELGPELLGSFAERCGYFKFVLKTACPDWHPPPEWRHIPWRRVIRHPASGELPNYHGLVDNLVELSTERSSASFAASFSGDPEAA